MMLTFTEIMKAYDGKHEWAGKDELLHVGHSRPNVVLLNDGSLMATILVPGYPFQMESPSIRNARKKQFYTLMRNIADDNVTIWTHLIRHRVPNEYIERKYKTPYIREFSQRYHTNSLTNVMANTWLLTLVFAPSWAPLQHTKRLISRYTGKTIDAKRSLYESVEDAMFVITSFFEKANGRRLGYRAKDNVLFSEIGAAISLIMYGRIKPVLITNGPLSSAIYNERVICGRKGIHIESLSGDYFGRMVGFKEYTRLTRTGMLDDLLDAPYPFVLTHSFHCMLRATAQKKLLWQQIRMKNAGDQAVSQIKELENAADDVSAGLRGIHHCSFAVYGKDIESLNTSCAHLTTKLSNIGVVPASEERATYSAYWSQVPGCAERNIPRPAKIGHKSFASLSSFSNFPAGNPKGIWGKSLMCFRTTGGTLYDYIPHNGEVGHTLIIGRTRSGKSLLLSVLALVLEAYNATTIVLDKDCGNEIAIRRVDGRYLTVRVDGSGLAPHRAFENTPDNCEFLLNLYEKLIIMNSDYEITSVTHNRLQRGINCIMRMPKHLRTMAGVRQFLGYKEENGAGARFERWCQGGTLGWVFDNNVDEIQLDRRLVGIDMTSILEHECCAAVGAYLLYRIRGLMDGRKIAVLWDEARFALNNATFSPMIEDFLLTMGKKEAFLVLAAQEPSHIIQSPIGSSIISQCQTKIFFPADTADHDEYVNELKCSEAGFRAISYEMAVHPKRCFLLVRETGPVILEFDLKGLKDDIAILSGRTATVRLLNRLREQYGNDPDKWEGPFRAQYEEAIARENEVEAHATGVEL